MERADRADLTVGAIVRWGPDTVFRGALIGQIIAELPRDDHRPTPFFQVQWVATGAGDEHLLGKVETFGDADIMELEMVLPVRQRAFPVKPPKFTTTEQANEWMEEVLSWQT